MPMRIAFMCARSLGDGELATEQQLEDDDEEVEHDEGHAQPAHGLQ